MPRKFKMIEGKQCFYSVYEMLRTIGQTFDDVYSLLGQGGQGGGSSPVTNVNITNNTVNNGPQFLKRPNFSNLTLEPGYIYGISSVNQQIVKAFSPPTPTATNPIIYPLFQVSETVAPGADFTPLAGTLWQVRLAEGTIPTFPDTWQNNRVWLTDDIAAPGTCKYGALPRPAPWAAFFIGSLASRQLASGLWLVQRDSPQRT